MKKAVCTVVLVTLVACNVSFSQEPAAQAPQKMKFEAARSGLEIPDELWARTLRAVGVEGNTLGYTAEQMASYLEGTDHVLPRIERLFRDARDVPRLAGSMGDLLLANASDPSQQAWLAFRFLGALAGRGVEAPKPGEWGVSWIPAGADSKAAIEAAMRQDKAAAAPLSDEQAAAWAALSERDRVLAARLVVATIECSRTVGQAFDRDLLERICREDRRRETLFELASAPWSKPEPGRASFDLLDSTDLKFLAAGSIAFLRLATAAVEEWKKAEPGQRGEFKGLSLRTAAGDLLVLGTGIDEPAQGAEIVIDLGGNDAYRGVFGSPRSLDHPASILVDLGGDDSYDGGDKPCAIACGLFGVGLVIDVAGNDSYSCKTAGLGCGFHGVGVLLDQAGNDRYTVADEWGQGAAYAGVGILSDLSGDDVYACGGQSQGFGGTLGIGALVDVSGNDVYRADLTKNISKPFGDRPVSFAQGAAFGRRADFGDGHSLGGGIGILTDGAGNDSYTAGVYGQGTGYWWGLGILEDRGGDDTYSNMWYSAGSAPHFAIGCCVDLSGNDRYNVGNKALQCQTQGCARDASIAWFIDGDGDDEYFHTNRCGGSGDLNSIAVFWDRAGKDKYLSDRNHPYAADRSWGGACEYPPFGGFRDKMVTFGLFLDTGGADEYTEIPLKEPVEGARPTLAGNDKTWKHNNLPRFRALGQDEDMFESASGPAGGK